MTEFSVHLELRQERTVTVTAETREQAVKEAVEQYPDFKPENIEHGGESFFVIGPCESCGATIFEDEDFGADDDGVYLCAECMKREMQPNTLVQPRREAASAATQS